MLKIAFTDKGLHIETLNEPLETWLSNRVLISLRSTVGICIEPSSASLIVPKDLPYFQDLSADEDIQDFQIDICDSSCDEVSLSGYWVAAPENIEEGVFVCCLSKKTEFFLHQLWKEGNLNTTFLIED